MSWRHQILKQIVVESLEVLFFLLGEGIEVGVVGPGDDLGGGLGFGLGSRGRFNVLGMQSDYPSD